MMIMTDVASENKEEQRYAAVKPQFICLGNAIFPDLISLSVTDKLYRSEHS